MPFTIRYPDVHTVTTKIGEALHLLYRNDQLLITNKASERSITHKLAEYIKPLFSEWHVDCEYNRLGFGLPKSLPDQATSYPDIIIHQRTAKANLLVIEAKSIHSHNNTGTDDRKKIKAYIEDSRYQYRFGLWICFYDELANVVMKWFENKNGHCCEVGRE
jgi:hypothetical protein